MRPTRLEIEGFNSFRRNVVLDFGSLDLFVITGPTGAGKSSLVDAIIYALYGRTPRISEKSISELISQGAERLRVCLEFKVGNKSYRLLRTLKRGSSTKLQLEIQDAKGEWDAISNKVAEVKEKVTEILGVDFDGFTKSIVLPQGEFDRFLRGDPSERRQILSDLLHLNIYEEMGKRARQIEQNNRMQLGVIEQHLATAYADATEDRKVELEAALTRLRNDRRQLSAQMKIVQKIQPWALELRKERDKRDGAQKELESSVKGIEEARALCRSLEHKVKAHSQRLDELDRSMKAVGYDEKRYLRLSSIIPVAKQKEELDSAIATSKKAHKEVSLQISKLEPAASKAKDKWEVLIPKLSESDKLVETRKSEYEKAKKRFGSTDVIIQTTKDWLDATEQLQEKGELEEKIASTENRLEEARAEADQLQGSYEQSEAALNQATSRLDELRRLHSVDEIRGRLKKGQPCPVCEEIVSRIPALGKHAAIETAQEQVKERTQKRDQHRGSLLKKQSLCESLPNEIKALRKNLRSVENSISSARSKVERILGKAPGRTAVEDLKQLVEQMSILEQQYETAREKLETLQNAEAAAREESKNKETDLKLLLAQRKNVEQRLEGDEAKRKVVEAELRGEPTLKSLTEEAQQLEKAKRQRDAYEGARKKEEAAHSSTEKERIAADTKASTLDKRVKDVQIVLATADEAIEKLERKIRKEHSFPSGCDELEELNALRSRLEKESQLSAGAIASSEEKLQAVVRGLKEVTEKRSEVKELRSQVDLYHELGVALKADQFIRFIVEHALRRLAEHGTLHLNRLSSGRYSFATQTDDFLVLDHWNADESRSVNTLSGGESFLASLSLALALGDALGELSSSSERFRLDSLFLDEGFSTLDPETLDVVVQGVESLAGGDRLVGIISHIAEMAERFPVRVEVTKAIGGSTVCLRGGAEDARLAAATGG